MWLFEIPNVLKGFVFSTRRKHISGSTGTFDPLGVLKSQLLPILWSIWRSTKTDYLRARGRFGAYARMAKVRRWLTPLVISVSNVGHHYFDSNPLGSRPEAATSINVFIYGILCSYSMVLAVDRKMSYSKFAGRKG